MMMHLVLSVVLVASTHAFSVQQMKGRALSSLAMSVESVDTKQMVKVGVIGE